jgi:Na+/H+ antiporter NhaD/arsenite permease-like protein
MIHEAATSGAPSAALYWTACAIFVGSLALIVSEKIHKTKVALLGAAAMILVGVLSQVEAFHSPHLGVDYNVVFLLISMMLIINILGRSGAFEWTAVKLAKVSHGKPFAIMAMFIIFTALFSAILDNVTTVLLFAPVTLLITDELDLDPVPFLVFEALASNIGGTATLIGDPPNLIIASRSGLTFMDFVLNLAPPVIVMLGALVLVAWALFGRMKVDETKRLHVMQMNEAKLIRDPALVRKSVVVLVLTTVGFVLHGMFDLEPATIALAGAALLLLVSKLDPHEVLAEVEWPTIFFFIGLFIIVGGVVKVGMVADLSNLVIETTHPTETSMFATSMMMLWFSAILSAFLDNIPYVATMAPLVTEMAGNVFHDGAIVGELPQATLHHAVLLPVWWSLALGACLGGNGSPIGASANVVVLGLAERSGHKVSFLRFVAYGAPVTLLTLLIATAYVWLRFY